MRSILSATAALAVGVAAQNQYTATGTAAVAAARATAKTESPTSQVLGKAFDRIAIIWLENTDYTSAVSDPNLAYLAKQGILLSNNYGVTHPSEPNYVASVSGETFGMDNDNFNQVPANISTVIDLLEDKGVSWSEYQEDLPYSGFEGVAYVNQQTKANDYVRKHNPAVIYNSVADNTDRLAKLKNFTMFYNDLNANKLPQWMFITPNMTDDGHDTSVTYAGSWVRNFITPLLKNPNFMQRTLVLITFDESETYTTPNRITGILLGDAVPSTLVGTTDSNFYDHYSQIATVEANWGLHTLGRWDVGANVYSFVAAKTGDIVRKWTNPPFSTVQLSSSYPGLFNSKNKNVPLPVPNTALVYNGRSVLPAIVSAWSKFQSQSYYTSALEIPDGARPPVYPASKRAENGEVGKA